MESPPKRVTRARAAATTDTGLKIATAASKAKVTRATSTTKRKTRADDVEEGASHETMEDELSRPEPPKLTRARAKKVDVEEDAPTATKPAARGRPKKVVVEAPAPEPARATRGRAKKTDEPAQESTVSEPARRTTRTRAPTITKAAGPSKSVKFEEPDKENLIPAVVATKGKAKSAAETGTGLRAKPVRKPAAATRTTRGKAKQAPVDEGKSSPLSPKKATQMMKGTLLDSDDELATTEKTPMKALMKSPVKPSASVFGTSVKLDLSSSLALEKSALDSKDMTSSIMASPKRMPSSPFKETLKAAPQKLQFGESMSQSPFKFTRPASQQSSSITQHPFKASLLQSPAKRAPSPTKDSIASPSRSSREANLFSSTPKASTFKISRFTTPRTVTRPGLMLPPSTMKPIGNAGSTGDPSTSSGSSFSGRMSSILPRQDDPTAAVVEVEKAVTEAFVLETPMYEESHEQHVQEEDVVTIEASRAVSTTPPCSPPREVVPVYQPRPEHESPFDDSDSEDELASENERYTPAAHNDFRGIHDFASTASTPFVAISKTPRTVKTIRMAKNEKIGFTPLARQLTEWMAASPEKSDNEREEEASPTKATHVNPSPVKTSFFDDEMVVREDMASADVESREEDQALNFFGEPDFDELSLDEEDLDLAEEADDMSMLVPEELQALQEYDIEMAELEGLQGEETNDFGETTPSEASQEYGDENAAPAENNAAAAPTENIADAENTMQIDPALLTLREAAVEPAFSTPKRVLGERICHTVSKVPLKPAADDTPMRPTPKKRSASNSKVPRPTSSLSRNNTVISYSPTKSTPKAKEQTQAQEDEDLWSKMGTPPRSPHRNLSKALLKGAVVFVDVHTTDGADASPLFTELLTQMGARCVKNWTWSNNNPDAQSKVGITHVVFKDGGKRTLERARETGGVVSCVGVSWVLDCERENEWLDEGLYAIDTASVPRGGHRRRKSMEPRALANMNGTLVPSATPIRQARKSLAADFLRSETPLTSKSRRRDSVEWTRSPASSEEDRADDQTLFLTPVPATPVPETMYGEDGLLGAETPGAQTPYFMQKDKLVQQTCPPKRTSDSTSEKDGGFLPLKKDENVMMRLMAARRKSLQWAPKVGSPLARGGNLKI